MTVSAARLGHPEIGERGAQFVAGKGSGGGIGIGIGWVGGVEQPPGL